MSVFRSFSWTTSFNKIWAISADPWTQKGTTIRMLWTQIPRSVASSTSNLSPPQITIRTNSIFPMNKINNLLREALTISWSISPICWEGVREQLKAPSWVVSAGTTITGPKTWPHILFSTMAQSTTLRGGLVQPSHRCIICTNLGQRLPTNLESYRAAAMGLSAKMRSIKVPHRIVWRRKSLITLWKSLTRGPILRILPIEAVPFLTRTTAWWFMLQIKGLKRQRQTSRRHPKLMWLLWLTDMLKLPKAKCLLLKTRSQVWN